MLCNLAAGYFSLDSRQPVTPSRCFWTRLTHHLNFGQDANLPHLLNKTNICHYLDFTGSISVVLGLNSRCQGSIYSRWIDSSTSITMPLDGKLVTAPPQHATPVHSKMTCWHSSGWLLMTMLLTAQLPLFRFKHAHEKTLLYKGS